MRKPPHPPQRRCPCRRSDCIFDGSNAAESAAEAAMDEAMRALPCVIDGSSWDDVLAQLGALSSARAPLLRRVRSAGFSCTVSQTNELRRYRFLKLLFRVHEGFLRGTLEERSVDELRRVAEQVLLRTSPGSQGDESCGRTALPGTPSEFDADAAPL